jgi:hypothetical protein
MGEQDWLCAIKTYDKGFVMLFLCYICEHGWGKINAHPPPILETIQDALSLSQWKANELL